MIPDVVGQSWTLGARTGLILIGFKAGSAAQTNLSYTSKHICESGLVAHAPEILRATFRTTAAWRGPRSASTAWPSRRLEGRTQPGDTLIPGTH